VVDTSSALHIIILLNDAFQFQQDFITDINLSYHFARRFDQIWSQSDKLNQILIGPFFYNLICLKLTTYGEMCYHNTE